MWFFNYIFLASFVVFLIIAHPINNDLSAKNDEFIKNPSPPMEFPQNDSQFPLVATNATLLHELSGNENNVAAQVEKDNIKSQEIDQNQPNENPKPEVDDAAGGIDSLESEMKTPEVDKSKIDTEVPDLLKIDEALIEPPQELENNEIPNVNNDIDSDDNYAQAQQNNRLDPSVNSVIYTSTEDFPKAEVEWIQNGHDNEDVRLLADDDTLAPSSDYMREAYSEHGRGVPLVQGRYAAILAGVFIVLAVVGYAVMLSWRRYLENRYGNRQMLINEDDIYASNDLKHFSL